MPHFRYMKFPTCPTERHKNSAGTPVEVVTRGMTRQPKETGEVSTRDSLDLDEIRVMRSAQVLSITVFLLQQTNE